MAAEVAGRAYITEDEVLKDRLIAESNIWISLGEIADKQHSEAVAPASDLQPAF